MVRLQKGMKFQSDTLYVSDEDVIDVYLEDTFYYENAEAMASCRLAAPACQVAFLLENLENVTLDFNGATVMLHGRIVPFILVNCKNIVIKNLKLDYDRPFYTQADVLDVKPGEIRMKICDGFDYEIRDGYLFAKSDSWEKNLNKNDCLLWLYDKTEKKIYQIILALFGEEIYPNQNPPLPIRHLRIREENGEQIITGDFPASWDANNGNNALLITHEVRDKDSVILVGCEDVTVQNLMLIHGAALGIVGMHTKNITIDHFDMLRNYNGNGRLVTNNADAIHLFNCSGKVIMKNCTMEGLLDDTLNVHNNYLIVKSVEGNRLGLYSRSAGLSIDLKLFNVGDTVEINRGNTVEAVTKLVIKDIETDRQNKMYYFTVEGDTSDILAEDTVENMSAQPEVYISDCVFGTFRGTMRLQSRSKTVLDNCVFHDRNLALLFTGDKTYWFESGPVNDLTIRNCTFHHVEYGQRFRFDTEVQFTEKENYYHKNILVENCTFHGVGELAGISHVDNFIMRNNHYDGECYIVAKDCGKLETDDSVKVVRE